MSKFCELVVIESDTREWHWRVTLERTLHNVHMSQRNHVPWTMPNGHAYIIFTLWTSCHWTILRNVERTEKEDFNLAKSWTWALVISGIKVRNITRFGRWGKYHFELLATICWLRFNWSACTKCRYSRRPIQQTFVSQVHLNSDDICSHLNTYRMEDRLPVCNSVSNNLFGPNNF